MSQRSGVNNSNSKHKLREQGILTKIQGKDGYVRLYLPNHPTSTKYGLIMEHRYIVEQKIGKLLSKNEKVHHINGIKNDNRIENLSLMFSKDHQLLHNPRGELNSRWIGDKAWNRRPRKEKYMRYEQDNCPDCNNKKDKRAKHCMQCSRKYRIKRR